MEKEDLRLDLGMLCRCCDGRSFRLPDTTGLTDSQVASIEKVCKLCVETNDRYAVSC